MRAEYDNKWSAATNNSNSGRLVFNANWGNNVYKDGAKVHPFSIVMNFCIKY